MKWTLQDTWCDLHGVEYEPSTVTHCDLFDKNDLIQSNGFPLITKYSSFCTSLECATLAKALEKSKIPMSMWVLLFMYTYTYRLYSYIDIVRQRGYKTAQVLSWLTKIQQLLSHLYIHSYVVAMRVTNSNQPLLIGFLLIHLHNWIVSKSSPSLLKHIATTHIPTVK